jgi:hypothetical protein
VGVIAENPPYRDGYGNLPGSESLGGTTLVDNTKKPPITVPVPGAQPMSADERAALEHYGLLGKALSTYEPPGSFTAIPNSLENTPPNNAAMENYKRVFTVASTAPLRSTMEQSERSSEKTAVSEGSWVPKNWKEARSAIVWGVLILGFGLEFCVSLLDANFGRALLALVGLGGLAAMVIHGEELRQRLLKVSPNLVFVSFALFLGVVILSPFIEEKRWPFSAWFPSTATIQPSPQPTTEEITKATAPLEAEIANLKQQLAGTQTAIAPQQSSPQHPLFPGSYDLSETDIRRLRDEYSALEMLCQRILLFQRLTTRRRGTWQLRYQKHLA